jgi:hypothetical protein
MTTAVTGFAIAVPRSRAARAAAARTGEPAPTRCLSARPPVASA